jgi:LmeA-like phospholipid-binding
VLIGKLLLWRLIRLVVVLGLVVGALIVLVALVVQPFVQSQAADAIGRQLDTKVTVDAGSVLSPSIVSGDVGDLKVHADTFKQGEIGVRNLRATVHGASLNLGSIFGGSPKLTWSSLDMTAEVRPGALAKYLRGVLGQAGVPGADKAFVHMAPGSATLIVNRQRIPVQLTVQPPTSILVTPAGSGSLASELGDALKAPVDVGPLPYGLRLGTITLVADAARVSAHAGKGHEKL